MYLACTGLQIQLNNKHSKKFYFSDKVCTETGVANINISDKWVYQLDRNHNISISFCCNAYKTGGNAGIGGVVGAVKAQMLKLDVMSCSSARVILRQILSFITFGS